MSPRFQAYTYIMPYRHCVCLSTTSILPPPRPHLPPRWGSAEAEIVVHSAQNAEPSKFFLFFLPTAGQNTTLHALDIARNSFYSCLPFHSTSFISS